MLFSNACRSDSKSPILPTTVAGNVTYLASVCESDGSCFWNPFFVSIAFFQLENPFFVNAGSALYEVSIPLWGGFKHLMIVQTMLLEMFLVSLLKSYSRTSLKFSGWYGLSDTFKNAWSRGLSCGSKSFSFPGCSLIRFASSTTPGSVSLVHGFTHDKSVPYLFSTPQARSQRQNRIFIHFLKKLDPVNDISGVFYLVDPM